MVAEELHRPLIWFCNYEEKPVVFIFGFPGRYWKGICWVADERVIKQGGQQVRRFEDSASISVSRVSFDSRSPPTELTCRHFHPECSGDAFGFFRLITRLIFHQFTLLMQCCHFIGFQSKLSGRRLSLESIMFTYLKYDDSFFCISSVCLCYISVLEVNEWERMLFY